MLLISRRFGIFLAALALVWATAIHAQSSHRTAMGFTPWPVDFNEDGLVDILELDILGQNWGAGSNDFANAVHATNIPEPVTVTLLGLGILALISRREYV